MTKFYDAVYSFERVRGYQFVKLYISMFEKWLSPQWLLAVSKHKVRMRVKSAWGQEYLPVTKHGGRETQRDFQMAIARKLRNILPWCQRVICLLGICGHR